MAHQGKTRQVINPGPHNEQLLKLHKKHISQKIWTDEGEKNIALKVQKATMKCSKIHQVFLDRLEDAGFRTVVEIGNIHLDRCLITALVERWRPETHTFHLTVGEATMTLQDVEIMTGLRVDGLPVTSGPLNCDWGELCLELLGEKPSKPDLVGLQLKLKWLDKNFNFEKVPANANQQVIDRYTRALILRICGGQLFCTKSADIVQLSLLPLLRDLSYAKNYAWGAAMLAFLYRELCKASAAEAKQIAGWLSFLQCWAYERITTIAPINRSNWYVAKGLPYALRWNFVRDRPGTTLNDLKVIRQNLDRQRNDEMVWEPYANSIPCLHSIYTKGRGVWRSVVPLMYFHIVEYHQPDRCMRQFGIAQHIPQQPLVCEEHHVWQLSGNTDKDWTEIHKIFIEEWDKRHSLEVPGYPVQEHVLSNRSQYMQWYRVHTRRWLSEEGALLGAATDGLQIIAHAEQNPDGWQTVRDTASSLLVALNEEDTYHPQPAPPAPIQYYVPTPVLNSRRRRLTYSRRPEIQYPSIPEGISQVPPPMLCNLYSEGTREANPETDHGKKKKKKRRLPIRPK